MNQKESSLIPPQPSTAHSPVPPYWHQAQSSWARVGLGPALTHKEGFIASRQWLRGRGMAGENLSGPAHASKLLTTWGNEPGGGNIPQSLAADLMPTSHLGVVVSNVKIALFWSPKERRGPKERSPYVPAHGLAGLSLSGMSLPGTVAVVSAPWRGLFPWG